MDKETEQNWGERDAAIHKFRGVVLGIDKAFLKGVIGLQDVIKPIMEPLSQTVLYKQITLNSSFRSTHSDLHLYFHPVVY